MRECTTDLARTSVFWLTRDRLHGELSASVEVWAVEPYRHQYEDGDAVWMAEFALVDDQDTCLGELSLEQARKIVGNGLPETDRECVRCGNPPTRASA